MKNAKLWKRILHEGIPGQDESAARIVTLPIVVDTRSSSEVFDSPMELEDMQGLSVPFPLFWLEGNYLTRSDNGHMEPSCWGAVVGFTGEILDALVFAGDRGESVACLGMAKAFVNDEMGLEPVDEQGGRIMIKASPDDRNCVGSIFWTICESMLLLGCKNVSLAARDPDPKQAKIATKRHGPTPHGYRYHVLVVRPAGSKPGTPGQEIGNMPRHVCRGHFAEYGPKYGKGKLFGRLEGRFYIPPHMKGNAKNGVVEKDYEVRSA